MLQVTTASWSVAPGSPGISYNRISVEWDPVSFDEAVTVFLDANALEPHFREFGTSWTGRCGNWTGCGVPREHLRPQEVRAAKTWEWLDALAGDVDEDFVSAVREQPETTERGVRLRAMLIEGRTAAVSRGIVAAVGSIPVRVAAATDGKLLMALGLWRW